MKKFHESKLGRLNRYHFLFVGFFLFSSVNFAQEVCTHAEGSFEYEKAVTVGNTVVITNPRLKLGENEFASFDEVSKGLRRALGMSQCIVGNWELRNGWVAYLFDNGGLFRVVKYKHNAIQSMTCYKSNN